MKNIFKTLVYFGIVVLGSVLSGCTKPGNLDADYVNGIKEISNPRDGKEISLYGETITVSFVASSSWDAELACEGDWAKITNIKGNEAQGKGSVRIVFDRNKSQSKRVAKLLVTVAGNKQTLVAEFTQAFNDADEVSAKLIEEMHTRLSKEYLWRDAYNALDKEGKLEKDLDFSDFLFTNLTKLGDVNIEDGGLYRDYSSLAGERYIYSYIQETTMPSTASMTAASEPMTKAYARLDLGIGVTMASALDNTGARCLIIGYVYQDSPAYKAGLRRGDLILEVNGTVLNQSNYQAYQQELYYNPKAGTYKIKYGRFDAQTGQKLIKYTTEVSVAKYAYNPVLANMIWGTPDKSVCIGYLVLESFDSESLDVMKFCLEELKKNEIKDLILDLRFNPGGSVPMCRYLLSSIVGPSHYDDTFCKMTFVDGKEEVWSFGYGNPNMPDGFNQGPDLGLKNLYVICSENTGSASELVINGLRGIGFPVTTIGSRTEGKNVGMTVSTHRHNGRTFEYAPITFRNRNARDFGDFANGFPADKEVNNQNSSYADDLDAFFPYGTADWELALRADACVNWAFSLITTGKDPDFKKTAQRGRSLVDNASFRRLENVPYSPKMGRFGSLIYLNENE